MGEIHTDHDPVTVDVRAAADPAASFSFRMLKRRFADTFVKCEVVGRPRGSYVDNLILEIAEAGPDRAVEVAGRHGLVFEEGPIFAPASRGLVEVSGRMRPRDVVVIPEPSGPVVTIPEPG
jgi:hypothetical protein